MNNEYFEKPLYPQEQFDGQEKNIDNSPSQNQSPLSSLFQGNQSQLLSLLLGLKGGTNSAGDLLSKLGGNNPLFQALSAFSPKDNKKESENHSPKTLDNDEIIY